MFAVITCLAKHDPRLLAWAVVICLLAVSASLAAYGRAASTRGGLRLAWIAAGALPLGFGVWATHFVAMLAYHLDMQVAFDPALTGLSMLIAICGMSLGSAIAAIYPKTWIAALGGAICGAAIVLMHFVGVGAMRLPAIISWDPILVAAAVAMGVGFASAAFFVAGDLKPLARRAAATLMLVLAICGLHFTAMAAVMLIPAPMSVDAEVLSAHELALGVGAFIALMVAAGLAMLAIDRFSAKASQSYVSSALDCAPSALAVFGPDGNLLFWNRAYAHVVEAYGLSPARGLAFGAILDAATARGVPEMVTEPARLGALADSDKLPEIRTDDGRWLRPGIAPAPDGGFVVTLTDITDYMELARREAESRELAESANRAKSEFLANMSHEIRTPLNGILGMVQVMRRKVDDPAQRDQLEVIDQSGQALLHILNNILDLSKIEAGRLELETHAFDLEELIALVEASFAWLAVQREIAFNIEMDPDAAGVWMGDSARIRQVLSNLLSNALKFTSEGAIDLRIGLCAGGLSFQVADTGVGIAQDKLELIFEKFTQADASTTRRFGGTGLGLAISRQLADLMGGELTAAKREGGGTTFSFTLPLQRGIRAPSAAVDSAGASRGAKVLRILAAEDNATNRLILKALLEPFDVDLTMVENGREAVEAHRAARFDAILMDVQMPELNGVEATIKIRECEREARAPRTPIIALTANVMRHQVESYLGAGMDGFVTKPIDVQGLIDTIDHVLAASQATDEASDVPLSAGAM